MFPWTPLDDTEKVQGGEKGKASRPRLEAHSEQQRTAENCVNSCSRCYDLCGSRGFLLLLVARRLPVASRARVVVVVASLLSLHKTRK